MKQQFLAISILIACAYVQVQSQIEVLSSSKSSMSSAKSTHLSASPIKAWSARYKGTADSTDVAKAIAVDDVGNVYVTGYSMNSNGNYDYVTIKYNNAGVKQWNVRYNGPANSHDEAHALALDDFGNVYVTGYSIGAGGSPDYLTVKYNNAGVRLWAARYNGPGNSADVVNAIAIDGFGNVYVTGRSIGTSGSNDYATIKYNSAGVKQWVTRHNNYDNIGSADDVAYAVAVDGMGNVYVTGYSYVLPNNWRRYATIKYNNMGVRQWIAHYNGPGNQHNEAYAITVDDLGYIYVTGRSYGKGTNYDYATIKYDSTGVRQWVVRYNGPGLLEDEANAIAVDDSGNVYVTGKSNKGGVVGESMDYATIKYNNAGIQQWVARYNGSANKNDVPSAIIVDSSGNVYVTGYSIGSTENQDYATVKYNSAGIEQWIARNNGPANSHDGANAIAVDDAGNVFVTGYSTSSNGTKDYVTIKYLGTGVNATFSKTTDFESNDEAGINTNITLPVTFDLAQNFPNPFNPTTTIRFAMPTTGYVKLTIYNLAGELVRTLVDGEMAAGYHQVSFDASDLASGIYFSRLEAEAFSATRKMVLKK